MAVSTRESRRRDGGHFNHYKTLDVVVGGVPVGVIQCQGPCYFEGRSFGHVHGPWIAFIGANSEDARNIAGCFDNEDAAIEAIVAASEMAR